MKIRTLALAALAVAAFWTAGCGVSTEEVIQSDEGIGGSQNGDIGDEGDGAGDEPVLPDDPDGGGNVPHEDKPHVEKYTPPQYQKTPEYVAQIQDSDATQMAPQDGGQDHATPVGFPPQLTCVDCWEVMNVQP
ncbi:MAG TPA: hypothetical protein VFX30_09085 [bacterium]|nr:hypothetical protein [bacterium]